MAPHVRTSSAVQKRLRDTTGTTTGLSKNQADLFQLFLMTYQNQGFIWILTCTFP